MDVSFKTLRLQDVLQRVDMLTAIDDTDTNESSVDITKHHLAQSRPWSWRLSCEESLSDWTIVVRNANTENDETYHVHKCPLSFGGSEYFSRLFQISLELKEFQDNTSRFVFESDVCDAFPAMLDYLYYSFNRSDYSFDIDDEVKCVGLRFLASYFGIEGLKSLVNTRLADSVNPDNCVSLLKQSITLYDGILTNTLFDYCGSNLIKLPQEEVLGLCVNDFIKLLEASDSNRLFCSEICLLYISQNQVPAKSEDFYRLTSCQCMPVLSRETALGFFKLIGQSEMSSIKPISIKILDRAQILEPSNNSNCPSCSNDDCLFDRCASTFAEQMQECQPNEIDEYLCGLETSQVLKIMKVVIKMNSMKGSLERIIVSGAGVKEVNGIYYLAKKKFKDNPEYKKKTIINGEETTLSIYTCCDKSGMRHWWIGDRRRTRPSDGKPYCFYYSSVNLFVESAVECSQWNVAIDGCTPAPMSRRGQSL